MKNVLKKLGVLGLIIAVLSPFVELPNVRAEDCKKHLQNYMFLDMNYFRLDQGKTFLESYASTNNGGYETYTVFPYVFLKNSSTNLKINWIEKNNFGGGTGSVDKLDEYWSLSRKQADTDKIYAEVQSGSYYDAEYIGKVFVEDTSHKGSTYVDNAIIFHGVWSSYDADGVPIDNSHGSDDSLVYEYEENDFDGESYSLQKIFADNGKLGLLSSEVGTALLRTTATGYKFGTSAYTGLSTQYFQDIVDGKWTNISESSSYIPLSITRTINYNTTNPSSVLNDFIYGYKDEGGLHIFTKSSEENNTIDKSEVSSINDSYTAMKEYMSDHSTASTRIVTCDDCDETYLDFNVGKAYYWPVILSVEYQSCSSVTENWVVHYDDNVDDTSVTNLPDSQTEKLGTPIKLSTDKPTRTGYVFKKWCETKEGSGKCYNPGDTIDSPSEAKTIPLYAQWGSSGPGNNEKTGVVSYIIGFAAVGVVAGGIYLISKKKNLFKQI